MCDGVTVMTALRYFSSRDYIFFIYKKIRNYHHYRHTVTEQHQRETTPVNLRSLRFTAKRNYPRSFPPLSLCSASSATHALAASIVLIAL